MADLAVHNTGQVNASLTDKIAAKFDAKFCRRKALWKRAQCRIQRRADRLNIQRFVARKRKFASSGWLRTASRVRSSSGWRPL